MMEFFQSIVRSIFGKIILGILCLGMAMWGFGDTISNRADSNLAKAGPYTFSLSELNQIVEQQQQLMNQNGSYTTKAELSQNGLIDQIFTTFANQTALLGYGKDYGIAATKKGIWDDIRSDSRFQTVAGEFSLPQYENYIRRGFGMSVTDYETRIRNDKTVEMMMGVLDSDMSTPKGLDVIVEAYDTETREASWFRLDIPAGLNENSITQDVLETYYANNSARYFQEETRILDVLYVSDDDFLHQVDVTPDTLEIYYETIKETEFAIPTPRSFEEIFFETEAQAQASIGVLGAGGAPDSLDGFTGTTTRTALQSEITDPALADIFMPFAQESQLLAVRQVGERWAVTRITDIPPVKTHPLEVVKDDVEFRYRQQQALNLLFNALEPLEIEIAAGATLSELAKQLGAPIISLTALTSEGVDIYGNKNTLVTRNTEALEQAFALETGEYTDLFDIYQEGEENSLPRGGLIIETRVLNPGRLPPLEALLDTVRTDYIAEQAAIAAARFESEKLAQINGQGLSFEDYAANENVDISHTPQGGVTRQDSTNLDIPDIAREALFRGEKGIVSAFKDGNTLLFLKINAIAPANPVDLLDTPSSDAFMSKFLIMRDVREAFENDARAKSGVQLNYQYLNGYKRQIENTG